MRGILLLIFLGTLLSCQEKIEDESVNTIKIKLGETGDSFLQRNNLSSQKHIDRQPAGLNFYEYNWGVNNPGNVVVEDPSAGFSIAHVLSLSGTESNSQLDAGIQKYSVNAGITSDDLIGHDEARVRFFELLQQLKNKGWKNFIAYEQPRLVGEDAFKYYLDNRFYNSTIDYIPTLDEWMKMRNAQWHFYAGDSFLDISIRRDRDRMTLSEPGAYLVSYTLSTSTQKALNQFQPEEINQWRNLWVEKIKSLKKERYAKEAELIKRGFTIYTEYEEPRIHPADPVEP